MSGSLTACLERLSGKAEGEGSDMGEDDTSTSGSESTQGGSGATRRIDLLERELSVNPLQYDKHLELIKLLRGNLFSYKLILYSTSVEIVFVCTCKHCTYRVPNTSLQKNPWYLAQGVVQSYVTKNPFFRHPLCFCHSVNLIHFKNLHVMSLTI